MTTSTLSPICLLQPEVRGPSKTIYVSVPLDSSLSPLGWEVGDEVISAFRRRRATERRHCTSFSLGSIGKGRLSIEKMHIGKYPDRWRRQDSSKLTYLIFFVVPVNNRSQERDHGRERRRRIRETFFTFREGVSRASNGTVMRGDWKKDEVSLHTHPSQWYVFLRSCQHYLT